MVTAWEQSDDDILKEAELRSFISELNEVLEVVTPGVKATRVAGTRNKDTNGEAIMRSRVAGALLTLGRIDSTNKEDYEEWVDEKIWMKRDRMLPCTSLNSLKANEA